MWNTSNLIFIYRVLADNHVNGYVYESYVRISIIVETFLRFIVQIKKENIMQSMLYKYYVCFFSGA